MADTGSRDDPYSSFRFKVSIDGIAVAGFSEVGGLTTETDVIEYRNGDETNTVRKLPGLRKYTNISFKRGYTKSVDLWKWRKSVADGKTERKSGSIILMDEAGNDALVWEFAAGWPTKWEGPAMNAKNNEVAIESMEIAVESLILKE